MAFNHSFYFLASDFCLSRFKLIFTRHACLRLRRRLLTFHFGVRDLGIAWLSAFGIRFLLRFHHYLLVHVQVVFASDDLSRFLQLSTICFLGVYVVSSTFIFHTWLFHLVGSRHSLFLWLSTFLVRLPSNHFSFDNAPSASSFPDLASLLSLPLSLSLFLSLVYRLVQWNSSIDWCNGPRQASTRSCLSAVQRASTSVDSLMSICGATGLDKRRLVNVFPLTNEPRQASTRQITYVSLWLQHVYSLDVSSFVPLFLAQLNFDIPTFSHRCSKTMPSYADTTATQAAHVAWTQ